MTPVDAAAWAAFLSIADAHGLGGLFRAWVAGGCRPVDAGNVVPMRRRR